MGLYGTWMLGDKLRDVLSGFSIGNLEVGLLGQEGEVGEGVHLLALVSPLIQQGFWENMVEVQLTLAAQHVV